MPAGSCQFIADARGSALALPRHTTLIMQRLGIRRRLRALVQTTHARAAHSDRADAGHDLPLGQMPVTDELSLNLGDDD